jgi:uncharacterized HAD superfamily protein
MTKARKGRLCIDIDNVIARTDEVMRQVIREFTDGRVDLDYNDIIEFDYHKCIDRNGRNITKGEWKSIHDLFSEPRYLWTIQPEEGVHDHLVKLSGKFDIHFTTSRLPRARRTTIEWLENYDFPAHDLHFLKHGEKHSSLGQFIAAVEDHYEQAIEFAKSGTPCYILEHPWNRAKPVIADVHWVKNWSALAPQLLALA